MNKHRIIIGGVVIVVIVLGWMYSAGYVPEIAKFFAAEPAEQLVGQLANTQWLYSKVFGPGDIPLPSSAKGTNAFVHGVYSPSVIQFGGKYWMTFGADIRCSVSGETLARDSIALAKSDDGISWTFVRYLREPNLTHVCRTSLTNMPAETLVQVNDPSLQLSPDGKNLYMFYTAAYWHPISLGWKKHFVGSTYNEQQDPNRILENYSCGTIGIIVYDLQWRQIFTNDKYLVPDSTSCPATQGLSRPDIQWEGPGTTRLWFDSLGSLFSKPIDNLNQLARSGIRSESVAGEGAFDVNMPRLDYASTVMLANGYNINGIRGIQGRARLADGRWSSWRSITKLTGQSWDKSYHSGPHLLVEPDTCSPKLYFSGVEKQGDDIALTIAVAYPPPQYYAFPACTPAKPGGMKTP